jgi:hypothetical protein
MYGQQLTFTVAYLGDGDYTIHHKGRRLDGVGNVKTVAEAKQQLADVFGVTGSVWREDAYGNQYTTI